MKRAELKDVQRIVIKLGTNTIMKTPSEINYKKLDRLAFVCSALMQEGKEIVIVTSGAVGAGASALNIEHKPETVEEQQAYAAIGQSILMNHYSRFFQYYGEVVAQMLLTRDVIEFPTSLENVKRTLNNLLKKGIVPIINENDVVSVDELDHKTKFGDNDTLSAIVANLSDADLLVILSDVDGLYDDNPKTNPKAKIMSQVDEINKEVMEMASGKGSEFSTGGMYTKLLAADIILKNDRSMIIASGKDPSIIFQLLAGDRVGTLFSQF